ncbi:MAG TPA: NUDIX domain-containing protein [Chloroflexia bacterium]|nr:NUDIX domain-containing protein [Chloroflexia bacterium]
MGESVLSYTSSAVRDYPNLFTDGSWGSVRRKFDLLDGALPGNLISNINIVPFIGDKCIIIRVASGEWEIPGGTLEPGETYLEAAHRELMEEAGARLLTFKLFGAWLCHNPGEPFLPHLPHPDFYRVVGYGQVEIIGTPLNPEGGENIVSVECVSIEEAAHRFHETGRPDLAELYRLAAILASSPY